MSIWNSLAVKVCALCRQWFKEKKNNNTPKGIKIKPWIMHTLYMEYDDVRTRVQLWLRIIIKWDFCPMQWTHLFRCLQAMYTLLRMNWYRRMHILWQTIFKILWRSCWWHYKITFKNNNAHLIDFDVEIQLFEKRI